MSFTDLPAPLRKVLLTSQSLAVYSDGKASPELAVVIWRFTQRNLLHRRDHLSPVWRPASPSSGGSEVLLSPTIIVT